MILNPKSLDPRDGKSPPVFQVESAMGAAISLFDGATALEVPRSRFFPVKKCDDLLVVRSDLFELTDNGELIIYDLADGSVEDILRGLDSGAEIAGGSLSVAVSKKHIFTFNAEKQVFFIYDKKGRLVETIHYKDGNYGFSLSYANGHIFVATDGDYEMGRWYGYEY